jgi:hypothetical protein
MVYQEQAKADALRAILGDLRLAAFAPGPADFALGADGFGRLTRGLAARPVAANAGLARTYVHAAGGLRVAFIGVTDFRPAEGDAPPGSPSASDPVEAARGAVEAARRQGVHAVVVLASVPRRTARLLAQVPGTDFVIAAREEGNAALPPERIGTAYLLTAPNQGKFLGVLDLSVRPGSGPFRDRSATTLAADVARLDGRIADLRQRIEAWTRDPTTDAQALASQRQRLAALERERLTLGGSGSPRSARSFEARALEIGPELPREPAVERTIGAYFRAVNEHNRAEYATLRAPEAPAGAARYLGIEACRDCHEEAYGVWARTPHSHAYRTLDELFKNFNLSCVGCHVTGYQRPGGSEVVQNDGLRDVQCESCHGPGSLHVEARTAALRRSTIRRDAPASLCAGECHTPEHSDHFDYSTYLPRILGPGHGRPMSEATDAGATD